MRRPPRKSAKNVRVKRFEVGFFAPDPPITGRRGGGAPDRPAAGRVATGVAGRSAVDEAGSLGVEGVESVAAGGASDQGGGVTPGGTLGLEPPAMVMPGRVDAAPDGPPAGAEPAADGPPGMVVEFRFSAVESLLLMVSSFLSQSVKSSSQGHPPLFGFGAGLAFV